MEGEQLGQKAAQKECIGGLQLLAERPGALSNHVQASASVNPLGWGIWDGNQLCSFLKDHPVCSQEESSTSASRGPATKVGLDTLDQMF